MLRTLGFVSVLFCSAVCFAKGYGGPAKPTIPADTAAIDTSPGACVKATREVVDGDDAKMMSDAATTLCTLRRQHQAARERLLAGLAKLVADFKDATNHDHAQRLPATIKAIQNVVKDCLAAVSSQQYCHNFGCLDEPEANFILCETKAAEILDGIIK